MVKNKVLIKILLNKGLNKNYDYSYNKMNGVSNLEERFSKESIEGVIAGVTVIQQGSFKYNPEHAAWQVRLGFKPTDNVYQVHIETDGGNRNKWIELQNLYQIGYNILGNKLSDLNDIKGLLVRLYFPKGENLYTGSDFLIKPRKVNFF